MFDDPYLNASTNFMNRFIEAQQLRYQQERERRQDERFKQQFALSARRLGMLEPMYKAQTEYYQKRNQMPGMYPSSAYQILSGTTPDSDKAGYYRVNKATGELTPLMTEGGLSLEPAYKPDAFTQKFNEMEQERTGRVGQLGAGGLEMPQPSSGGNAPTLGAGLGASTPSKARQVAETTLLGPDAEAMKKEAAATGRAIKEALKFGLDKFMNAPTPGSPYSYALGGARRSASTERQATTKGESIFPERAPSEMERKIQGYSDWMTKPPKKLGHLIQKAGRLWRIIDFDEDGEPLVELAQ